MRIMRIPGVFRRNCKARMEYALSGSGGKQGTGKVSGFLK